MDAPPVRYVRTADGYDIAYAVSGAGEPVVLLPTGMNHIQLMWRQPIFRAFYEAIASHYRLVQFDGRGFGLSSRGLRPGHKISDRIRDLDAVLQELRLDRFLVIAPHHQCHVAVPYILDRPGRVNALVLWNPIWNQAEVGNVLPGQQELVRRSWELYVRTIAQNFHAGDIELEANRLRASATPEDFLLESQAALECNLRTVFPRLDVPALVIASQRDAIAPAAEENFRAAAALIRGSRLVMFDFGMAWAGLTTEGEPPAAAAIIDFFEAVTSGQAEAARGPVQRPLVGLSDRELEVLRLLARGKTNPEIAKELFITRNTVQNHVASILSKANLTNRAQAAVYAKEHGLV